MTKQVFLIELQRALSGKVAPGAIQNHVKYYDDYISMEVRKGKTEEEVLENLGDARLLAKTIVSAEEGAAETAQAQQEPKRGGNALRIPGWLAGLTALLLFGLLLYAAGALMVWLLPIVFPLAAVWLLIRYIRRR